MLIGIKRIPFLFVLLIAIGCHGNRYYPPNSVPAPERLSPQDRILQIRELFVSEEAPQNYLRVLAGGDVMLGHWTLRYLEQNGADYPFKNIQPFLKSADIVFANLEAPFADSGIAAEKAFTFKVPTHYAASLQKAGFNLLSIANNHILDYGLSGLQQTISALKQAHIYFSGAGMTLDEAWHPAILSTSAGKVAAFAFSMTFPEEFWATDSTGGTAYPYEQKLTQTLDSLRTRTDFMLVSFHWGAEKQFVPKDYQIYFAHLAIDHGADLVIGHHPHVLQGLEIYKNRLIAYSLGNLAFSSYSSIAVNSMLLKVVLHREGLLYARIFPLNVNNSEVEFQPELAEGLRKKEIIARLDSLSRELTGYDIMNDEGLILGSFQMTLNRAGRHRTAE